MKCIFVKCETLTKLKQNAIDNKFTKKKVNIRRFYTRFLLAWF